MSFNADPPLLPPFSPSDSSHAHISRRKTSITTTHDLPPHESFLPTSLPLSSHRSSSSSSYTTRRPLRSYLTMPAMRVSRNNAKLYLNLSLALNLIVLIALFLPSEQAHTLLPDAAWDKVEQYGLASRNGRGLGQAVMESQKSCRLCEVDEELCAEVGQDNLAKALGYTGTNNRLRRALAKMRRGGPFTVGVVGGSVSKGQGLADPSGDNAHGERNFNRMVFEHLNSLFPSTEGVMLKESGREEGKNSFINGAQGGMGTDYFSLCFNEHIPDDVDLVLVEFGINDEVVLKNMETYELLVRGLLDLPNKPAVINLQIFALKFQYLAGGGDLHNGIAQYYDIPYMSLRNVLLPGVLNNSTLIRDLFVIVSETPEVYEDILDNVDLRHLSRRGHELLGQLAIAYIDSQLCEMERIEASLDPMDLDIDSLYPAEPLPRSRLMAKFDPVAVFPKLAPQCYSTNAKKNKLKPFEQTGWRDWGWKEKNYIIADVPGSKISFKFSTGLGLVQLHYLRSYQYHLGSAWCWVDDDSTHKMRLDGYWKEPYNIGKAATIRKDLEPGEHTLHCELLNSTEDPDGGKEFRIISVMSI